MLATGGSRKVEILDVEGSLDCKISLPDFPVNLENAVAKLFNHTPWICGGNLIDGNKNSSSQCFSLDVTNLKWIEQPSMIYSRSQSAASVVVQDQIDTSQVK